jgi:hypothetical protein
VLRKIVFAVVVLGTSAALQVRSQSPGNPTRRSIPDFDIREELPAGASVDLVQTRMARLASFQSNQEQTKAGTRLVPNEFGLPKLYFRDGRTLTAPSGLKPSDIARSFLRSQPDIFSLPSSDIDGLRLAVEDVTANATFLAFNQTLNGIDVFNGQVKVTLSKAGEVVQVTMGNLVPGLNVGTTPKLNPEEAVKAAFTTIGLEQPASLAPAPGTAGKIAFVNPQGNRFSAITAELSIFPMDPSSAVLAYLILIEVDSKSWYEVLIDAGSGRLLFRHNLYVSAGQARVWTESPMKGTRTLVTFPDPSDVNPNGWLPSNGTVTTGNNVDAFLDANGDDKPDTVSNATLNNGRAFNSGQVFDFDFGDGTVQLDPRFFQPSSITNLFYFVNIAHDYYYNLGFNETAGNFQTSNFDRGGLGNDAVIAEAQQGDSLDDAAFAPTPDGIAPKLRAGIFTRSTTQRGDDLDASYDGQVIVHEYGHGVSNRLVGAKASISCLIKIQSAALGEGWSDYFSISIFNNPVEGSYITQDAIHGIRRYSYEGYPLTYEDIGNGPDGYEEHDDGEIWAGTLWDLRKILGASTTDRLVINGLKATPCNPSMTDARDAILAADQAANNGANRTAIWTVFARHGLGYSAFGVDGAARTGTRYDAAYDLPPDLQTTRNPAITSDPLLLRPGFGDPYVYTINASNPGSGVLNYSLVSGPGGMTLNASTGAVAWTTGFISPRVKITVTDGKGGKVVHGYLLPVLTVLRSGTGITIAGGENSLGYAAINVPAGTPVLQVTLRGGTGDADLLVLGPTGDPAASGQDGNFETLSFANPDPGEWQVLVYGFQSYSNVRLVSNLITPTLVSANTTLSDLNGDLTSETFYRFTLPNNVTALSVSTNGGIGDVDVFLRRGAPAVCQPFGGVAADCLFDKLSARDGNIESITIATPAAGDWYLDLLGYAAYSGVQLNITTTYSPLTLAAAGAATTRTEGIGSNVVTGYATATVESGVAPYGIAVFSLSQNGTIVSEAGVPASPPVQSARVFIDYRTGVAAGTGVIDIYTGLAIANRGTATATIAYTLRDRNGQVVAIGQGGLPANAHRARFVHQLQDLAPNFNVPANFPTAIQFGSLEITSSQPVSVLGLRLTTNQRGETLLTSTAVADLSRAPASSPVYFPQLADGGGYTTSIVLSNTSSTTEAGTAAILDDDGNPLSVRVAGGATGSSFNYSIPAGGVFVLQTDGSPDSPRTGWVKITPDSGNTAPVGAGVFSYSPGGILVTESGIPSSPAATRARVYVDKANGHDTGLAIGNPGASPITITMQAFQSNGSSAGIPQAALNIPANGHRSRFVGELLNGLPNGFTGIADLTSSSPFVPLTLRSLMNARGDFLLTTFPAPDVTQPAPSPIVFPQIADGGGYATQFIFISANGAASVSVNFIGDDGLPLSIGRTQ